MNLQAHRREPNTMKNSWAIVIFISALVAAPGLSGTCVQSATGTVSRAHRKIITDDIPFTAIDAGTSSGIATRDKFVIKDADQWLELWQRHTAHRISVAPPPTVDFTSEMVLAVFAGEHHSQGSSIQIDSIKKADNRVIVLVSETNPGGGAGRVPNPLGETRPYFIARTAQSSVPVVFQGM